MTRLLQILLTLGVNTVPVLGFFLEDWSWGTILGIYWFENVAASLFMAGRILVHRRLVLARGHFRYQARKEARQVKPGPYLPNFLVPALIFTAAHGFFLVVLVFLLTHNNKGAEIKLSFPNLLSGCGLVLLILAAEFLVDLPRLRSRSFSWVERRCESILGRVIVVHLTLIFGMAAVAFTGATRAFFGVFAGLKTLADLSSWLPQWDPEVPPQWLCRIMDKTPNVNPGKTFEQFWKEDKANERARRAANDALTNTGNR